MIVNCKQCGKEFKTKPSRIKIGLGKYCSNNCFGLSKANKVKRNCLYCNKEFKTFPSAIKRNGGKYCSRKCHILHRIKKIRLNCLYCEKRFETLPSRIKIGCGKYCSHKCWSLSRIGIKRTDETKRKISESEKGKIITEEHKEILRRVHTGRIITEETRKKMSEGRKGENNGNWKGGTKATYERRKTSLKYQLNHRMSSLILFHLKRGTKNNRHWEDLVGYTVKELTSRLKSTIPNGYGWQDYISGKLQIDHIVPVSVYNFDKPEDIDFQKCWSLSNLQLLTKEENNFKRAKLTKSHQPSFKL